MDPSLRSASLAASARVRAAWASAGASGGSTPDPLAQFIRVHAPAEVLIDAVIADAEERRARGLAATLEHYAAVLPRDSLTPELRRAVLMVEAAARSAEPPDAVHADMLARHPDLADDVHAVMAMAGLMRDAHDTMATPETPDLRPGDALAKYVLVQRLGSGSFGEVWHARDTELDRYIALKLLFTAAPAIGAAPAPPGPASGRFIAEARAAAALDHENIVAVHHAGAFGCEDASPAAHGRLYIDSQLVGDPAPTPEDPIRVAVGRSLEDGLDPELPRFERAREAARITEAVARAVAAAHSHGILHRDLKPANILITPSGRPMVADFGLSISGIPPRPGASGSTGAPDPHRSIAFTSESGLHVVGTPAYMAPEQARGEAATPLTDVFALGAILRFLLTGMAPYSPSGRLSPKARDDVIAQARAAGFSNLRASHPSVPSALAAIADRAMAAHPADRYVSAEQLAADVRAWLTHRPTIAARPSTPHALALWYRRNLLPATISTVAALIMTAGTARFVQRLAAERDLANQRRAEAEEARDATAAVNQFMQETMFLTTAAKAGERITVNDMLTSAIRRAGTAFAGRPLVEASVRHAIGSSLLRFGSFDQTSEQLATAIRLRTEHLGPEHPDTLRSRVLLTRAEFLAKRDSQAETDLDELIPLCERKLGTGAEETCLAIQTLGRIHEQSHRDESAERLMRRAVSSAENGLGGEHPRTLDALSDLYNFLSNQYRFPEALEVARRVADTRARVLGPDDYSTLTVHIAIANMLRRSGRHADAEPELRRAYDGLRTSVGPVNRSTLTAGAQLAELLMQELHRPDEALSIALEVEKNRPRGPREPLNWQTVLCVAQAMAATGDEPGAVTHATELFHAACTDPGPESPGAIAAARFLAGLHEKRSEHEPARVYREHLRTYAPSSRP